MKTRRVFTAIVTIIIMASLSFVSIACNRENIQNGNVDLTVDDGQETELVVPDVGAIPIPNVPVGPDGKLVISSEIPDMPIKFHPCSSGKTSSIWGFMEDEKAEAMIITFWAVWCEPCKAELPYLEVMYRKHKGKGLRVLAVTIDPEDMNTEDKITEILKDDQQMNESWKKLCQYTKTDGDEYLSFPVAVDDSREMSKQLGVTSIPRTILITKDHKIYYQHVGFDEGKVKDLEEKVKEYLKIQE